MARRKKRYSGDEHNQPYNDETNLFDRNKPDADREGLKESRLVDLAEKTWEYKTLKSEIPVKEWREHKDSFRGAAERGSDGDDDSGFAGGDNQRSHEDRVATSQLVQDGGGYSTQTDPAEEYTERFYGYCLNCGEPIQHAGVRFCEFEAAGMDKCELHAPHGRLLTGCQSCREWWDTDRGYHRGGVGRQSKTCKPTGAERAAWTRKGSVKSRCAIAWAATLKRAARQGIDRETAERTLSAIPKLRHHNRVTLELDLLDAKLKRQRREERELRADRWENYDLVLRLLPEDYAEPGPARAVPGGVNGTGFRAVKVDTRPRGEDVLRLPLMGEGTIAALVEALEELRKGWRDG